MSLKLGVHNIGNNASLQLILFALINCDALLNTFHHYSFKVVLSSLESQKALLTKDELAGRYIWPFSRDRSFHKELGVVFSNGKFWYETRKFTLKTLRDFGFGRKSSMDSIIHEELSFLIAHVKRRLATTNNILTIHHNFDLSMVNVLWSLVTGHRFNYDDPILNEMLRHNDRINDAFNFNNIYLPFPFLRHWFPKLTGFKDHMESYQKVQLFMKGLVNTVRSNMSGTEEPSNFIEVFLKRIDDESFSGTKRIYTGDCN